MLEARGIQAERAVPSGQESMGGPQDTADESVNRGSLVPEKMRVSSRHVVAGVPAQLQYGSLKVRHDLGFRENPPAPPFVKGGRRGDFQRGARGGFRLGVGQTEQYWAQLEKPLSDSALHWGRMAAPTHEALAASHLLQGLGDEPRRIRSAPLRRRVNRMPVRRKQS